MSPDNVETLRLLADAFNRRDIDDGLQYLHPEIEFYPGLGVPDEDMRYLGHQRVKGWFLSATGAWESVGYRAERDTRG